MSIIYLKQLCKQYSINIDYFIEKNDFILALKYISISCSICLVDYKKKDITMMLPCKHKFHTNCINIWLHKKSNCPLCRKKLDIHN